MRKLLIGTVVVAILAVCGYVGVSFYAQHRAAREVAAAFAAIRAHGAVATHGSPSFDLWTRTLTVPDVALASAAEPTATLKVGRLVAHGLSQPDAGRIAAERIEIADVDVAFTLTLQSTMAMSYKAPQIVLDGYSGPAAPLRQVDTGSAADLWRFGLEHFAATTLASLSIPTLTAHMEPSARAAPDAPADGRPALGSFTYVYTGVAMRDLRNGRLAASTVARVTSQAAVSGPNPVSFSVDMTNLAALDFDANALLAVLAPAGATDDAYHRVYRQLTVGGYATAFGQGGPGRTEGMQSRIDGITVDDVGLRPSKLQVADLFALVRALPAAGTQPSPAAAKVLIDQAAQIYEGIRIGRFDMSGITFGLPQNGAVTMAAVRVSDFTAGRIGEFAIEGLEIASAAQPVNVGRFALKSLAVADLLRASAEFGAGGARPGPEQLLGLLRLLQGVEVRGIVAPYKTTGESVAIETLAASWGQFVGVVPTTAHISTKVSAPIVPDDPAVYELLGNTAIRSLTASLDLGAAWDEKAAAFALAPATIEFGGLFAGSVRASLANVRRDVFALDPMRRTLAAAAIRAGPVEIVVRDQGGLDILLQKFATEHQMSLDDARKQAIDEFRDGVAELADANSDMPAATEAVAAFLAQPGATLTLRITPKDNISLIGLIAAFQQDQSAALGTLGIAATTTR